MGGEREWVVACLIQAMAHDCPGVRSRRKYVVLVMLGLVIAGLLWVFAGLFWVFVPSREPEYNGKRLSEWVEQLAPNSRPKREDSDYYLYILWDQEAFNAIQSIGISAKPFLLKWIRYEEPLWKTNLCRSIRARFPRFKPHWMLADSKERRTQGAVQAFRVFDGQARDVLPALCGTLREPKANAACKLRVVQALGFLGQDGSLPLGAVLTNQAFEIGLRRLALQGLSSMWTNARPAIPALMTGLEDKDESIAVEAGIILDRLNVTPAIVLNTLINRLDRTNSTLRIFIRLLLGSHAREAGPAVPALVKLLNHEDEELRKAATNALEQIAPEVLETNKIEIK